jgi:ketosteroid isomerase-like protein
MTSAQEHAATIRRGYELFNSGNLAELAGIFAEDAIWHVGGRGQLSGEKRGREACFAHFGQLGELTQGTFRAEVHDVVGGEAHTVGVHTVTGQRNGRTLSQHTVLLFHMRDGQVAEAWEHYEDSQAWDEFFS